MAITTVIDTVTRVTYTLARIPLGEGATAKVWRGVGRDRPDQSAAIKIAHMGTPAAALAAFEAELMLLELLSKGGESKSVPWAHPGQSPEEPAASIIIMELIPDDWQLAKLALETGRLGEVLALETAIQYAQLLVDLHALGYCTYGDRKATDVRYDRKNKRLVVLDWNRAAPFPPDAGENARCEWVRQDIRGFGRMWAERVLGRTITDLPGIDDTGIREWSDLTRGFRRILARSVGARPAWGYESAEALLTDLKQHYAVRGRLSRDSANRSRDFLAEIDQQVERGRNETDPGLVARIADSVQTLLDLAARLSVPNEDLLTATAWAQTAYRQALQMAAEAVDRVYDQLKLEDYRAAVDIAREALQKLQDGEPSRQTAALRVLRWQIVAELGLRGNDLAQDMSSSVAAISRWLHGASAILSSSPPVAPARGAPASAETRRQLRLSQLGVCREELGDLIGKLPQAVAPLAEPFRLELLIRSALASGGGDEDAAGRAAAAYRALHELHPTYGGWLRGDLAELDHLIGEAEADSTLAALRSARQAAFQRALSAVREQLASASQQPWTDLTNLVGPAREAFLALGRLTDGATFDDRAGFQFVSELAEVNRAFVAGDHLGGMRLASSLSSLVAQSDCDLASGRAHDALIAEVKRILATPPNWPDEREQVVALLDAAGETAGDLAVEIEDWGQRLRRYWHVLNLSVADMERLWDLEASRVDDVLADALMSGIEVIDRRWVPADNLPQYTVTALIGRREMARLAAASAALEGQLGRLIDSLSGLGQQLTQAQEIKPKLRVLDTILADNQVALAQLQQKFAGRHAEVVPQVEALVSQVAQAKTNLETTLSQLDDLQQDAISGNMRLVELTSASKTLQEEIGKLDQLLSEADSLPVRVTAQTREMEETRRTLEMTINQAGGDRLQRLLVEARLMEGMMAVRHLDARGAKASAKQVRKLIGEQCADCTMQAALELLEQSAAWLGALSQSGEVLETLKRWRSGLDAGSVRDAQLAYQDFTFRAARRSDLEDFWLVAEMLQELNRLRETQQAQYYANLGGATTQREHR